MFRASIDCLILFELWHIRIKRHFRRLVDEGTRALLADHTLNLSCVASKLSTLKLE